MSVRVYLVGNEVCRLPDFKTEIQGSKGDSYERHTILGVRLYCEGERWYANLDRPDEPIPPSLRGMVHEVTFRNGIHASYREIGIYRLRSAEAELEGNKIQGSLQFVRIRGKKIEDVRDLLQEIKAGSIRPEVSHEKPQSGLSWGELRERLDLSVGKIEELKRELDLRVQEIKGLREKTACFARLSAALSVARWPFCSTKRMAGEIKKILKL